MDNYFRKCSDEQVKLIAQYNAWALGEKIEDDKESLYYENFVKEHCGDEYVEVLYEDKYNLVYVSIDSGIKVIINIGKIHFDKSESMELL